MNLSNFTITGLLVLLAGFVLAALGSSLYVQQNLCISSFSSCNLNSVESALRTVAMYLSLLFGTILIIVGAVFTASGHVTQHLSSQEKNEEKSQDQPLRMCVKCGRQVGPAASFCPSCGNQLPK